MLSTSHRVNALALLAISFSLPAQDVASDPVQTLLTRYHERLTGESFSEVIARTDQIVKEARALPAEMLAVAYRKLVAQLAGPPELSISTRDLNFYLAVADEKVHKSPLAIVEGDLVGIQHDLSKVVRGRSLSPTQRSDAVLLLQRLSYTDEAKKLCAHLAFKLYEELHQALQQPPKDEPGALALHGEQQRAGFRVLKAVNEVHEYLLELRAVALTLIKPGEITLRYPQHDGELVLLLANLSKGDSSHEGQAMMAHVRFCLQQLHLYVTGQENQIVIGRSGISRSEICVWGSRVCQAVKLLGGDQLKPEQMRDDLIAIARMAAATIDFGNLLIPSSSALAALPIAAEERRTLLNEIIMKLDKNPALPAQVKDLHRTKLQELRGEMKEPQRDNNLTRSPNREM